jgi:S1-C subfamily serine protease
MAAPAASRRREYRASMPDTTHWQFPPTLQPEPDEVLFDLDRALGAVVRLSAEIPEDAYTAEILGTERGGNGIVIRDDGLILTIGYLITEAESIWIATAAGKVVPGHALAYDFTTGFGLVLPLGSLGVKPIPRGSAGSLAVDDEVYVIGHGGRSHALKAQVFGKREFAGYWEYLLEEAVFTTPPHPEWSGAALLDRDGRLVGVGSLFVQEAEGDETLQGNMFVPVDLLEPILDDLVKFGRARRPAKPWLGLYAAEERNRLVVGGLADGGPAERAGVHRGDTVVEVAGERVSGLADLLRRVWALGPAGTEIPLTLTRDGVLKYVQIRSADRGDYLKKPSLQ